MMLAERRLDQELGVLGSSCGSPSDEKRALEDPFILPGPQFSSL